MESFFNLKNFGDTPQPAAGDNSSLPRQNSIYSLTFDGFQNNSVGHGKDFGSMNMDELLKNIWTAEETHQAVASSCVTAGGEGNLQRQGSLTLPPTLGQKTVDEVWRDLLKESSGGSDSGSGGGGSHLQQRQSTLGEMTLEEFLMRSGVLKEEVQPLFCSEHLQPFNDNTTCLPVVGAMGIQQSADQSNVPILANSQLAVSRLSPDGIAKTRVDKPSSLLTPHCMYRGDGGGGRRGRKCGREKLMEQKYNRMMKNRESAARSRARKQVRIL